MTLHATILYEDSRKAANGFGPHALVLACVADRLGREFWSSGLRAQFDGVPRNSNGNVLSDLGHDRFRSPVVAVFDDDKVRELLKLGPGACKSEVLQAIRDKSEIPEERLVIVLLERNMETVLAACCRALGDSEPRRKPKPDQRDAICYKAVNTDAAKRKAIVDDVRTTTFKRPVDIVERFARET